MPYCAHCGNPVAVVSYAPCPRCGNPSNGAPRPVADGGGKTAGVVILIVVGGLVAVAFVGILAAIAIPNFLTAQQRAKQKRTMADIRSLATAAEAYATDKKEYPKSPEMLVPTYISRVLSTDGWGRKLEYECLPDSSGTCTGYAIGSMGKDGAYDAAGGLREAVSQRRGATTNFDCDIIFSDGTFVQYPEGVQR